MRCCRSRRRPTPVPSETAPSASGIDSSAPAPAVTREPTISDEHVILGLDGAYVRDRHPRPTRTFEVVVGQVRSSDEAPTRLAFVRQGSAAGAATIGQVLRTHGVSSDT